MNNLPALNKILKEEGVVCHAFSTDGTLCAVSLKKSHSIEIYRLDKSTFRNVNTWKYECQLNEHQQTIACLSFSIQNKLLSVSHDKSILVWQQKQPGVWIKEQVQCENKLGFLKCAWSPNGKKFAAAGGDRKVFIGYYDTKNNWWCTLSLKTLSSSITALAFHPSSKALFVGSTDFSAQIVAVNLISNIEDHLSDLREEKASQAKLKDEEELYRDLRFQEDDNFKGKFTEFDAYNTSVIEISKNITNGWVESAAFSPDGLNVCFSVHNSTIFNISLTSDGHPTLNQKPCYLKGLPVSSMTYTDNQTLVCGMYDGQITAFKVNNDSIVFDRNIDSSSAQSSYSVLKSKVGLAASNWEKKGNSSDSLHGHSNPVICLQNYPAAEKGSIVSSNDINGQVFFWDI